MSQPEFIQRQIIHHTELLFHWDWSFHFVTKYSSSKSCFYFCDILFWWLFSYPLMISVQSDNIYCNLQRIIAFTISWRYSSPARSGTDTIRRPWTPVSVYCFLPSMPPHTMTFEAPLGNWKYVTRNLIEWRNLTTVRRNTMQICIPYWFHTPCRQQVARF